MWWFLDGGRTRIRTRVAGLEGQSDIQLHYTSNQPQKYLFDELWGCHPTMAEHIYGNAMASSQLFCPKYNHNAYKTSI